MRREAFLGRSLAAASLAVAYLFRGAGSSAGVISAYALPDFVPPALLAAPRLRSRSVVAHAKVQAHTGAGGAGMHRAWKARRASGRL